MPWVLAAIAAATAATALLVGGDEPGSTPAAASTEASTSVPSTATGVVGPIVVTQRALEARVRSFRQPVFWAGRSVAGRYELTRTAKGAVLIRYLPRGAKAGSNKDRLLLIGTYALEDAYQGARRAANNSPTVRYREVPNGGIAVFDPDRSNSVYVAFPGLDYQIEIYDPSPERAREIAGSGRLQRVGAKAP